MNDFFVTEDENNVEGATQIKKPKHKDEQISAEETASTESPAGYVPVKLSSNGKLKGVPAIVHVKDYTGRDTLNLSMSTTENQIETILNVVKNITYEDFDPMMLHENDLEELLINVYVNFWETALTDIPYPMNIKEFQELDEDKRLSIENRTWVPKTDVILSTLKSKVMDGNFKEPIVVTNPDGTTVSFMLPRVGQVVRAGKLIARKYIAQETKWQTINRLLQKHRPSADVVDDFLREHLKEDYYDYIEYSRNKTTDLFLVKQAQCIVAINGEPLQSIDEQINRYDEVSLKAWEKFGEIQRDYTFGINHYAKVKSPFSGKLEERRLSFRFQDFFPTVRDTSTSECTVSFG